MLGCGAVIRGLRERAVHGGVAHAILSRGVARAVRLGRGRRLLGGSVVVNELYITRDALPSGICILLLKARAQQHGLLVDCIRLAKRLVHVKAVKFVFWHKLNDRSPHDDVRQRDESQAVLVPPRRKLRIWLNEQKVKEGMGGKVKEGRRRGGRKGKGREGSGGEIKEEIDAL